MDQKHTKSKLELKFSLKPNLLYFFTQNEGKKKLPLNFYCRIKLFDQFSFPLSKNK
jgi:hypothetical protein